MATVQRWTGVEAHALRVALRFTVRGFAEHLGVAVRTISKWESGEASAVPRPDSQAILDTTLGRADDDAKERFRSLCSSREQASFPLVVGASRGDRSRHRSDRGVGAEEDDVNRRALLISAGITIASGLVDRRLGETAIIAAGEAVKAVEWLAWQMWQRQVSQFHCSEVPRLILHQLDTHPGVHCDSGETYAFTGPQTVDQLVAQRIFADIAGGSASLLATAQTSYATDLTIGALASANDHARRGLTAWMRRGATPVLRVNAAGVLAKVGHADLGDVAISALGNDIDVRHLYLTAVMSRVLETPWEAATVITGDIATTAGPPLPLTDGSGLRTAERLAAELTNSQDAAARWCSAVLLSKLPGGAPDVTRTALGRAAREEPCRENLRAYAAVMAWRKSDGLLKEEY